MHGLPKLLGLDFGKKNQQHHVSHCFGFKNGYRIPNAAVSIAEKHSKNSSSVLKKTNEDSILFDPVLTYGHVKKTEVAPFKPHFVLYDKKSLKFNAFFKQESNHTKNDHFRTRFANIFYFLEDDTIVVIEPEIDNCGFPQGKLVRRGKIIKNKRSQFYTWKDFNIGIDLEIQGIVFHIVDCDKYTKDFLLSNGIELNATECLPYDLLGASQKIETSMNFKCMTKNDKLNRYLKFQGKVLHFDCVLKESGNPTDKLMTYKLYYYLEDDTVAIKELKENREGRYHFPMLLRRQKLPKCGENQPSEFPSIFMEKTAGQLESFYAPCDLKIGETVNVYGRKFLLLDCDIFTRKYYEFIMKPPMPQPERLTLISPKKHKPKSCLPPYLGLGTPQDSLASCYNLIPKSPRKDIINSLANQNKYLRYSCIMDSEFDQQRRFILMYSLADDTIQIIELPSENSGIQGGRFLCPTKLIKPDSNPDDPIYYSAADFYIGATIHVFSHRFTITNADLYVYNYMQSFPERFSLKNIESVRNNLILQGYLKGPNEINEENVTKPKSMLENLQNLNIEPEGVDDCSAINKNSLQSDEENKNDHYHETRNIQLSNTSFETKNVHFNDETLTF
ncbi:EF-hand domain-containing protein 1-like [Culicoides brevitarsis]|uniref:EF-hand domain-containing protein 1-like n=1 Tax=Culicoides brevitarsis TaxID=469753 RepID=UPI00307BE114